MRHRPLCETRTAGNLPAFEKRLNAAASISQLVLKNDPYGLMNQAYGLSLGF